MNERPPSGGWGSARSDPRRPSRKKEELDAARAHMTDGAPATRRSRARAPSVIGSAVKRLPIVAQRFPPLESGSAPPRGSRQNATLSAPIVTLHLGLGGTRPAPAPPRTRSLELQ
jgi:hypothetical protein